MHPVASTPFEKAVLALTLSSVVRSSGQLKGILCLILSSAIFALTDGISKLLTSSYPPGEIMFFRAVFVLVPVGFMVWRNGGMSSIRPVNVGGQVARGLIVLLNSFLFIIALKHLPLADMTAIMFASPLILTALAPFFLGETVGWRRWTAVLIGFAGTLMMVRPSGDAALWPSLMALGVTVLICFRDIVTRHLSKTDSANAIMIWSTVCIALGGLATIFWGWPVPDMRGLLLLMVTGMLQGVAQYLLVYAFIYGEAVVVTPFRYFSILWATLYGYLLFGDVPRHETMIGASIVMASGLYVFYRETMRARAANTA